MKLGASRWPWLWKVGAAGALTASLLVAFCPRVQPWRARPPSRDQFSSLSPVPRLRAGAEDANLIIILADAARADHFSLYGYALSTTPHLDELMTQSVVFTEAYATASSTKTSLSSLFTAQFPDTHGAVDTASPLARGIPTLAECLQATGRTTVAFSGNPFFGKEFAFDRGFDQFEEVFRAFGPDPRYGSKQRAAQITEAAVQWFRQHRQTRFFAYLHYLEPHAPYDPPREYRSMFSGARIPYPKDDPRRWYDASLRYVDDQIGALLQELQRLGLYEKSVIVFLADHGEAFGEHGETGHGNTVYQEMIHVPLAIRLPNNCGAKPQRRAEVICLTDLMPTLLDLFGAPTPPTAQGRSRLGLLAGEPEKEPSYAVSRARGKRPAERNPRSICYALTTPQYTLVLADLGNRVELYDRLSDPEEKHNLAKAQPAQVEKLRAKFAAWAGTQSARPMVLPGGQDQPSKGEQARIGESTRRQLRSLGYLE